MKNYLPLFLILLFSMDLYAQDISGTPARDALALQSYLTGYNVAISKINQLQNEITSSESNLLIAAASDKTAIQNKIDSLQIAVSNIKPEAIDNGKAVLAILNYYSVESIQDLNSIRNMDFNYFINTHVRDIITKQTVLLTMSGNYDAGQGKVEELPVSEAGIFDATSTLDALGTFIAERFKEELTIEDFYTNIIVKIIDEPEIDVSLTAWSVNYDDAEKDSLKILLEGVEIPYMGIESLIKRKLTEREQDKWDVLILEEIRKMQYKEEQ